MHSFSFTLQNNMTPVVEKWPARLPGTYSKWILDVLRALGPAADAFSIIDEGTHRIARTPTHPVRFLQPNPYPMTSRIYS
jgi:hypothetical protein